ncbi:PEP-CTERM sorting domain-containing protein [Armatimonas sp.]|uniref:PEP-CTERM sorting domain-containing protein n=1 Tax=Armatimonas sp. TaxID=1872638 RepID=UPI00375030C7
MNLSRNSFLATLATLTVVALTTNTAQAQTLLYDITAGGGGSSFGGFGGNWGFNFTTTSTINVGSLGLWDESSNGLIGPHQVGIFSSGGGAALVSATVDNSSTVVSSANASGRWLFTSLGSSFSLPAGAYTLGFFNPASGLDDFRGGATTAVMAGASLLGGKARSGAPAFAWPDAASSANSWYGPNLMTGTSGGAAPEPGTLVFLALGGGLVWARRRK